MRLRIFVEIKMIQLVGDGKMLPSLGNAAINKHKTVFPVSGAQGEAKEIV